MTRKSAKSPEITEEMLDKLERGEITQEELMSTTLPAEKPVRKGYTKKTKFSSLDLAKKINMLFFGLSKIFQREPYIYNDNDFIEEAESFNRLIDKFPILGVFFMTIDPFIIILNLYQKFNKLGRKQKVEPEQKIQS